VVLFRNRIILSPYSLLFDFGGLVLFLDHLIFLIIMMVLTNLILEMDRNRIDDLQERVIGVDHVSMIPVRRGLLYSGADVSVC
jgi:nitrate reductase gamma subunit